MSIMSSSTLPRSSPAEFRTLSPASVLAARTRRYFLSGSAFLILLCIEMLLILLEPCTFDAYRASRPRRCCSLRSIGPGGGSDLPRWIYTLTDTTRSRFHSTLDMLLYMRALRSEERRVGKARR